MSFFDLVYREVDARASRGDRAEGPARRVLLTGVLFSAAIVSFGLLVGWFRHEIRPNDPPSISELVTGVAGCRGTHLVYLGLLLLAATPILRVMVMVGVYLRRRERFMVAVSALVLGLLALSVLLGTG